LLSPCSIIGKFIPPLTGTDGKMNSSISQQSTIFLTDDEDTISKKVMKYAKSGSIGDGSLKQHQELGGDVNADIPCQYLKFFEMDDEKLNKIYSEFSSGKLSCGEVKSKLIEKLKELILEHQKKETKSLKMKLIYSMQKKNLLIRI